MTTIEPPVSVPNLPETVELQINPAVVALQIAPPTVGGEVTSAATAVQIGQTQTGLAAAQETVVVEAGPLRVIFASVPVTGPEGPVGPGGSGAVVIGARLTPVPDGVRTLFTAPDVYIANSTGVFLNGIREIRNLHYSEYSTTQVQFTDPPLATDILSIDYTVT